MIVGFSLLACLLFLMLVVASNSYFIRSIVDPVLKINTIAKGDRGRTLRRAAAEDL